MTRSVCIIQARIGSTRLPGKVLLPLPGGRTVLEELIFTCKRIRGIDEVIVATPDTPENDKVADIAFYHCRTHRGSENDVLGRYMGAAAEYDADIIMRVTADCPLIPSVLCSEILFARQRGKADYASNVMPRSFPKGYDCEVFTRELLEATHDSAEDSYDREHVTPYMQRVSGIQRINVHGADDESSKRFTLDTLDDYNIIWDTIENRTLADPFPSGCCSNPLESASRTDSGSVYLTQGYAE